MIIAQYIYLNLGYAKVFVKALGHFALIYCVCLMAQERSFHP